MNWLDASIANRACFGSELHIWPHSPWSCVEIDMEWLQIEPIVSESMTSLDHWTDQCETTNILGCSYSATSWHKWIVEGYQICFSSSCNDSRWDPRYIGFRTEKLGLSLSLSLMHPMLVYYLAIEPRQWAPWRSSPSRRKPTYGGLLYCTCFTSCQWFAMTTCCQLSMPSVLAFIFPMMLQDRAQLRNGEVSVQ